MLPSPERMQMITDKCLELFDSGSNLNAAQVAIELLSLPELPMHCPDHHFLVPAALFTAAHSHLGNSKAALEKDLRKTRARVSSLQGGICGEYGCCGAAVGAGVFASIWNKTAPLSKEHWAAGNELTARCLASIATVEGPRCCKRVTYLTLQAAMPASRELLGVDLGEFPHIVCQHHQRSKECREQACPFFPPQD